MCKTHSLSELAVVQYDHYTVPHGDVLWGLYSYKIAVDMRSVDSQVATKLGGRRANP